MTSSSSSSPEISAATASDPHDRFSYKHATHDEVLEDLSSRFILNLPDKELSSLERICFQVEQAHWFYEDFIREENPKFPSLPLKKFSAMLFHACPLLHQWSHDHEQAFNTFMQYKTRVPVCGAIMLNDTWEKCILVKGWKSSSGWGFPKGKINEDEPEPNCAVREVLEETGYNLAGQINPEDVIEMSIKEQKISLYVVPGVPEDYPFKTKTRKEISKIEWFKLTDLPTWKRNKAAAGKFYLISPFIGALKAFINERKPRGGPRKGLKAKKALSSQNTYNRMEQLEASPLPCVHYDATHESSSQSSSADNGDPHTPSPQYAQSVANHVAALVDDDIAGVARVTESIDPHFARLLSSLTMSAQSFTDKTTDDLSLLPTNANEPAQKSTPSLPATSPPTGSRRPPDSVDQANWPTPTNITDRPRESPIDSTPVFVGPPLAETDTFSSRPPEVSVHSAQFASINHSNGRHQLPLQLHSDALCSKNSIASPPLTSPRSSGSRRTSSTADISPYLSRPAELPTSAKRLKQLALLESVADESAKMSPFLTHQLHALGGKMSGVPDRFPVVPGPPASVPPRPMMSTDPNDRIIYSSRQSVEQSSDPFNSPSQLLAVHDDPFQVRPRTSHNIRNGSIYAPTMNQTELLSLMHGSHSIPVQTSSMHSQPSHIQNLHRPAHYHTVAQSPRYLPTQPAQLLHTLNPFPFSQDASVPLSAPALSPTFDLSSHSTSHPNNNARLLSILNGNRADPGASNTMTYPSLINNRT